MRKSTFSLKTVGVAVTNQGPFWDALVRGLATPPATKTEKQTMFLGFLLVVLAFLAKG